MQNSPFLNLTSQVIMYVVDPTYKHMTVILSHHKCSPPPPPPGPSVVPYVVPCMAAIIGPGDRFCGGTVHGVTIHVDHLTQQFLSNTCMCTLRMSFLFSPLSSFMRTGKKRRLFQKKGFPPPICVAFIRSSWLQLADPCLHEAIPYSCVKVWSSFSFDYK